MFYTVFFTHALVVHAVSLPSMWPQLPSIPCSTQLAIAQPDMVPGSCCLNHLTPLIVPCLPHTILFFRFIHVRYRVVIVRGISYSNSNKALSCILFSVFESRKHCLIVCSVKCASHTNLPESCEEHYGSHKS